MPSSPEPVPAETKQTFQFGDAGLAWNRRLHYYFGLYFLFFIWLFALTGLLLNHGSWSFAAFWPDRRVSTTEQPIQRPAAAGALAEATDVMRQLGIAGEIQWLTTPPNATRLEFRVTRPGLQFGIKVDWKAARASVQRTQVNTWGFLHNLHTFTGVRMGDSRNQRDWILTTVWALSMDAVAVGLVLMVLSGVIMWLARPAKRARGLLALGGGVLVCGWLVFGLQWLGG